MSTPDTPLCDAANDQPIGLSAKQWITLFFTFLLGIAATISLNKVISPPGISAPNTVQAATMRGAEMTTPYVATTAKP